MGLRVLKNENYNAPWGPFSAVLVTIGIFIGSQIIGAVLLGVLAGLLGMSGEEILSWATDSVMGRFAYIVIVEALTLGLLFWFLYARHAHPRTIGLISPKARDMAYTFVGFLAYLGIYLFVLQIVQQLLPGLDLEQEQEIGFDRDVRSGALVYVFMGLVILPPIVEEILVRGFLYSGLRTRLNVVKAGLLSSLLFAVAHLQWQADGPLLWIAAIDTFILSLVLVYLRERTGSIWSPIGVHMIKNGLAFTVLFVITSS